jgi:hypothetical protein
VRRHDDQAKTYQQDPTPQNQSRLDRYAKDVNKTFHCLLRVRKQEVRNAFDRKQAVIDIERQLLWTAIYDEETKQVLRTEVQMPREQICLLEKVFTWPASRSLEDEWARRNAAGWRSIPRPPPRFQYN